MSHEPFFGEFSAPLRGEGFSASENSGSLLSFLFGIENYLLSIGKQAIDTPEERAAVVKFIMDGFDTYIAPQMRRPAIAAIVRNNISRMVQEFLETLAK